MHLQPSATTDPESAPFKKPPDEPSKRRTHHSLEIPFNTSDVGTSIGEDNSGAPEGEPSGVAMLDNYPAGLAIGHLHQLGVAFCHQS
jgi:hypothetical protein